MWRLLKILWQSTVFAAYGALGGRNQLCSKGDLFWTVKELPKYNIMNGANSVGYIVQVSSTVSFQELFTPESHLRWCGNTWYCHKYFSRQPSSFVFYDSLSRNEVVSLTCWDKLIVLAEMPFAQGKCIASGLVKTVL